MGNAIKTITAIAAITIACGANALAFQDLSAPPPFSLEAYGWQLGLIAMLFMTISYYSRKKFNNKIHDLHDDAALIKLTTDAVQDAILIVDYDGVIIDVNQAAINLFGYGRRELLSTNIRVLIPDPEATRQDEALDAYRGKSKPKKFGEAEEYFARTAKGEDIPVLLTIKPAQHREEKVYSACIRDIREQVIQNEEIHQLAFTDKLTRLPNLTAYHAYIDRALANIKDDERLVFAIIEIEQFGDLNSTFGFAVGDHILQTASKRFQDYYASAEFVSRVGADTFALVWSTNNKVIDPVFIVKGLLDYASAPIDINNIPVRPTFNAGVIVAPDHTVDPRYIMPYQSQALKSARMRKGQSIELFNRSMTQRTKSHTLLAQELRSAIDNEELTIYVQPKVDMSTRHIKGTESLLRWQKEDGSFVPPAEFIPLAEKSDLIFDISRLVMRKTLEFNRDWHDRGLPPIVTSLNISPPHLVSPYFVEHIIEDVTASGVDPRTFECEVTETATMENRRLAVKALQRLRDYGILITLDDFGTGHASLQYIAEFPVDILKIDQSFVSNFTGDENRMSLVNMVNSLAKQLNLSVIAEGVETAKDEETLLQMGITEGQGYYYAKPMNVDQMLAIDWTQPITPSEK